MSFTTINDSNSSFNSRKSSNKSFSRSSRYNENLGVIQEEGVEA